MAAPIRQRLNMSNNQGRHECGCRQPARYGSVPHQKCQHCDGTGYTNDPARKKDWAKEPPHDDE